MHELGPLDHLVHSIQDDTDEDHRIVREERSDVPPSGKEDRVSIGTDSQDHEEQSQVGDVRLPPSRVGKRLTVVILGLQGAVEEQVDRTHDNVVHHLACLRQVGQPFQALRGTGSDRQKRKERENHSHRERPNGNSVSVDLSKHFGRVSVEGKRV